MNRDIIADAVQNCIGRNSFRNQTIWEMTTEQTQEQYDAVVEKIVDHFFNTIELDTTTGIMPSMLRQLDDSINEDIDDVIEKLATTAAEKSDEDEPESQDFSEKNICTDIPDTQLKFISRALKNHLGLGLRGMPSKFELLARAELIDQIVERLDADTTMGSIISDQEMLAFAEEIIKELFTPEHVEELKAKAVKAIAKDNKASNKPTKKGPPKKGSTSLAQSLARIPVNLLEHDPYVNINLNKITRSDLLEISSRQLPSKKEIRYLVDSYYAAQKFRISLGNQIRACGEFQEPSYTLQLFYEEQKSIEAQFKTVLDVYTDHDPVAWTLKQIWGVGPVISAGLVNGFDPTKAKSSAGYMRYCGLDPTLPPPTKGVKLQYDRKLKTLVVYKLGESFVKVSNRKNDIYGHVYAKWMEVYHQRNDNGEYAAKAKRQLESKNWKATDSGVYNMLSSGKLSNDQIYLMSKRKAVSLLIQHLFELQFAYHYHCVPPRPYIYEYGDSVVASHQDFVPNPLFGIYESRYGKLDMSQPSPYPYKSNFNRPVEVGGQMLPDGSMYRPDWTPDEQL